jgi:hypothetical protein
MSSPTNMPPTPARSTPKPGKPRKPARPGWVRAELAGAAAVVVLALVVLLTRWLRTLGPVQDFLTTYPGQAELPASAPLGLPDWLGWQHFLNAFLILLIVRCGWLVRTTARP